MLAIALYDTDREETINVVLDGENAYVTEVLKGEKFSGPLDVNVGKAFRAGGKIWRWNGEGLDYMGDV